MTVDAPINPSSVQVIDGLELKGGLNVSGEQAVANVRHSIRLGHPQVSRQPERPERVVLVGSGPSLRTTEAELVQLVHEGAVLVTLNGAYHWCRERNLRPGAQIVMDARATNARFLTPEIPRCRYYVASQCHPDLWATVQDYPNVGIFHAVADDGDSETKQVLDAYYTPGHWVGMAGGTTVLTRALGLLRTLGYLRFEIFGADSCWFDEAHHAFEQPENQQDERHVVEIGPRGRPDLARRFVCSPWHLQQFSDFVLLMKLIGQHFLINVHGEGLLAYAVRATGELEMSVS
jgi:hypothetical protein